MNQTQNIVTIFHGAFDIAMFKEFNELKTKDPLPIDIGFSGSKISDEDAKKLIPKEIYQIPNLITAVFKLSNIKTSQFYNDIDEREFKDPIEFKANQYFSIGQNEETQKESFCWVWYNNQLLVKKGSRKSCHKIWVSELLKKHINGWYDPIQKMISFVFPSGSKKNMNYTEEDIPRYRSQSIKKKIW